ncbi:MAG TPA: lantibiotic dehydratase, partial [Gemmatimonadaceae bacterium]|nr:lantibiotic dehydratase [Gemmatimonadaceae bacterium]
MIGSVSDKRLRNRLLELRRDLFNLRLPAPAALAAAAIFSPELLEAIQQTIAVLRERDATVSQLRDAHERELVTARERFRCALTDTDFEKGLALSSRTLFRNLDRYRLAPADAKGSRVEQIERGLLRYFTRMATKATPFGRFCAVIPGEFAHADGPVLAFKGDPGCKSSVARLNKRIYAQLWDHVKRRAAVRARLPVEVNPTLRREAGQFVFLTAIDGREVFQRVPVGEMLDVVLEHSARTPPPLMAELINRLLHDPRCDANEPDSRAVIHRLIEIGMLRSGAIVAEQEADWLEPMCAFLSPIEDEHAQRIVRYLESLRASGGRFVEA